MDGVTINKGAFNRTIVELKRTTEVLTNLNLMTFNRTIVELKQSIKTYEVASQHAFNRTIVELKLRPTWWHRGGV